MGSVYLFCLMTLFVPCGHGIYEGIIKFVIKKKNYKRSFLGNFKKEIYHKKWRKNAS